MTAVIDSLKRPLKDLRISITDRCNLRCQYCLPEELFGPGFAFSPREEILTYEWFAAAGEITIGEPGNTATWTAPNESGLFSVSCSVTDEYYGLDIATIEITVE